MSKKIQEFIDSNDCSFYADFRSRGLKDLSTNVDRSLFSSGGSYSGYNNLPSDLTINGVTRKPDVQFRAEDCDGLVWRTTAGTRFQSAYFVQGYSTTPTSLTSSYHGAVYSPNQRRIYFAPFRQGPYADWHYIDCDTGICHTYAHGATVVDFGYAGGIYDPYNDRIYFCPRNQSTQPNWHYINCATGQVVAYAHGLGALPTEYSDGGFYSERLNRIYFVPFSQSSQPTWHYIDCSTGAVVSYTHGATCNINGYSGAAYSPTQRRWYFSPWFTTTQSHWHYLDEDTGAIVAYTHGATVVSNAYMGAEYSSELNRIYFGLHSQSDQTNWHYVDCNTGSVVAYAHGTGVGAGAYRGVGKLGDKIFMCPRAQAPEVNWHYIDCNTGQVVPYLHTGISTAAYLGKGAVDPVNQRLYFSPLGQSTASTWHYIGGVPVTDHGVGLGEQSVWCDPDATATKLRGRFESENTGFLTLGLKDLVCEWVGSARGSAGGTHMFSDWQISPSRVVGLTCLGSAGRVNLYLRHDSTERAVGPATSVTLNDRNHYIYFADRSGSARCYLNGVSVATTNISALVAQTLGGGRWQFTGHRTPGANACGADISHLAIWTGQDWLDTHEQDALAMERFQRACGIWPELAAGTAAPLAATRASSATLEKLDSNGNAILVPVGTNWLRTESFKDENNVSRTGLLLEEASTNLVLYSQDFSQADWVKSFLTLSSIPLVRMGNNFTGLIPSSDNDVHAIHQVITVTAASVYTFSFYICAGYSNQVAFLMRNSVSNIEVLILFDNLDTVLTHEISYGSLTKDLLVENKGNGVFRVSGSVVSSDTALLPTFYAVNPAGDVSFAGDGATVYTYIFGLQLENKSFRTSYIPTTTAAVSRSADILRYSGVGNLSPISHLEGLIRCHTYSNVEDSALTRYAFYMRNSTNTNNTYLLGDGSSTSLNMGDGGSDPGSIQISEDVLGSGFNRFEIPYKVGKLDLFRNGSYEGTDDGLMTLPTSLTEFSIGSDGSGNFLNGHVCCFDIIHTGSKELIINEGTLVGGARIDELGLVPTIKTGGYCEFNNCEIYGVDGSVTIFTLVDGTVYENHLFVGMLDAIFEFSVGSKLFRFTQGKFTTFGGPFMGIVDDQLGNYPLGPFFSNYPSSLRTAAVTFQNVGNDIVSKLYLNGNYCHILTSSGKASAYSGRTRGRLRIGTNDFRPNTHCTLQALATFKKVLTDEEIKEVHKDLVSKRWDKEAFVSSGDFNRFNKGLIASGRSFPPGGFIENSPVYFPSPGTAGNFKINDTLVNLSHSKVLSPVSETIGNVCNLSNSCFKVDNKKAAYGTWQVTLRNGGTASHLQSLVGLTYSKSLSSLGVSPTFYVRILGSDRTTLQFLRHGDVVLLSHTITSGEWITVRITRDSSNLFKMWVNGEYVGSVTDSYSLISDGMSFVLYGDSGQEVCLYSENPDYTLFYSPKVLNLPE
jgi:hypothetical protein